MRRTIPAFLLFLAIPLGAVASNRVGDANNDHAQDMADAALVQSRLYGLVTPAAVSPLALAGVNDTLDLADMLLVAQIATGARTGVGPRPGLLAITPPPSAIYSSQITPNPVLTFGVASAYPAATNVDGMNALGWSIGPTLSSISNFSLAVSDGLAATDLVAFNPSPSPETFSVGLAVDIEDSNGAPDHQATASQFFTVNPSACGDGVVNGGEACETSLHVCCAPGCGSVSPSGTECRPSGGDCDPSEKCNGTGFDCPANTWKADGANCGDCPAGKPCGGCGAGVCMNKCGNGAVDGGETCDDGAMGGIRGQCSLLCDGNCDWPVFEWSRAYGGNEHEFLNGFDVDMGNNLWVTGGTYGNTNLGGGPLPGYGDDDIILGKYDPLGNHLYSSTFGGALREFGDSVVVDGVGNTYVSGLFWESLDMGCGVMAGKPGPPQPERASYFLAKRDPAGNCIWSRAFVPSEYATGHSTLRIDRDGNLLKGGSFMGTLDMGGGVLGSPGLDHLLLSKFDPSGNLIWARDFPVNGGIQRNGSVTALAVDGMNSIWITGHMDGTVNFGGDQLISASSWSDCFLAKFDSSGNHLVSKRFGDSSHDYSTSIESDNFDNIYIAGNFYGGIDFGMGLLTSAGELDLFLAKFDSNATALWSKRFGDVNSDIAGGLALSPNNNLLFTGAFSGTADFGQGGMVAVGAVDAFVASYAPNGDLRWSWTTGGAGMESVERVQYGSTGSIYLAGIFSGVMNLGDGNLQTGGDHDIFLVELREPEMPRCYECGDGIQDPGEICDEGPLNGTGPGFCNSLCSGILP